MRNPKIGLILGYNHFFSDKPPATRLELIKSISRKDLIAELAACNYRIKPPLSIYYDYNPTQNVKELAFQLRSYPDIRDHSIKQYKYHLEHTSPNSFIYHRAGLLFAINEILRSDEIKDIEGFMFSGYDQANIFKYLLVINDEVTQFNQDILRIGSYSDLEKINLATLSLNEYMIPVDPLLILYRAGSLFEHLENTEYKDLIKKFIIDTSGYSPHEYIYQIISMFFAKHMQEKEMNWYYKLNEGDAVKTLFDCLSRRRPFSDHKLEFLDLKKSPFLKAGELQYILLDNGFLLQMTNDIFIWSFLFDSLLSSETDPKKRRNEIKRFYGCVGLFFESHIERIIKGSFVSNGFVVRCFKELVIRIKNQEKELGDIYIRKKNKILIAEAKTTRLINKEKYASSIDEFYDEDRDRFYKKHGLNQLAISIRNILDHGRIVDNSIPRKRLKIFPVLIYNDMLLSNPFFNKIFEEQFRVLVKDINDPCVNMRPLTMMHISDWEILESAFSGNRVNIFDLIDSHYSTYKNTMSFHFTSNERKNKGYPTVVNEYYYELISKYGKK